MTVLCYFQMPLNVEKILTSILRTLVSVITNGNVNTIVRILFLVPPAEGQRAIVMALCPSCVRLSFRTSVRACVCKLFLKKTSTQKL